uniref:Uncharacterized protein n=1 Tax=Arundo donax TaxID=35708 RepID=A0A0A8ZNC4_ARUDO
MEEYPWHKFWSTSEGLQIDYKHAVHNLFAGSSAEYKLLPSI